MSISTLFEFITDYSCYDLDNLNLALSHYKASLVIRFNAQDFKKVNHDVLRIEKRCLMRITYHCLSRIQIMELNCSDFSNET